MLWGHSRRSCTGKAAARIVEPKLFACVGNKQPPRLDTWYEMLDDHATHMHDAVLAAKA